MLSRNPWYLCALTVCSVILPLVAAESESVEGRSSTSTASDTQCSVIQLKHADCESAARHVRALFEGKDRPHKITWYTPANAVLLRATADEIKQMEFMLARIDVPKSEAKQPEPLERRLQIIPVQYAKAEALAVLVKSTLRESGSRSRRRSTLYPQLVIDERTNVIVIHGTQEQITRAMALVKALDIPIEPPKAEVGQ